jgi:glycosyltransferase involved in cell wall biosynthesis
MIYKDAKNGIRRMAMLGNHTPRQCGIATFTADLNGAIRKRFPELDTFVLAMNDPGQSYAYPGWVRVQIAQEEPASYLKAAAMLNRSRVDVLSIQHEYGIYGGEAGSHLLGLMREVHMPMVTTLHTILSQPDAAQWAAMDEIIRLSERMVVMSSHGADILHQVHGVPLAKIDQIPHGIPTVPFQSQDKGRLGLGAGRMIFTFGLLAPDKGVEYVIEAMPGILARFPDTVYVVLGATHPNVKAHHGESYRKSLEDRARELGVGEKVVFLNRFATLEELTEYLAAADIYITPYLKMEQITSGTLAYAVGSGKAVISTPYLYAKELLAEGRGILVPCRDPEAITREVVELLANDAQRLAMRHRAAEFGRTMAWPVVAASYMDTFRRAHQERMARTTAQLPRWHGAQVPLAEPGLTPLGAHELGLSAEN